MGVTQCNCISVLGRRLTELNISAQWRLQGQAQEARESLPFY